MKALMILYPELLKHGKEKLYSELERNVEIIKKIIGIDSMYASVSSHFKDLFDRFPDLCLINSVRENPAFAAYRGLRKLRGSDVLLIDGSVRLTKEGIFDFINRLNVTVGMLKDRWAGVAFIKMRDLDYTVKSLERNFEKSVLEAFYTLRDTYSIVTDFVEIKDDRLVPISGLEQCRG